MLCTKFQLTCDKRSYSGQWDQLPQKSEFKEEIPGYNCITKSILVGQNRGKSAAILADNQTAEISCEMGTKRKVALELILPWR